MNQHYPQIGELRQGRRFSRSYAGLACPGAVLLDRLSQQQGVLCISQVTATLLVPVFGALTYHHALVVREKLVKVGVSAVRQSKYVTFQLAEVAVTRELSSAILQWSERLTPSPPTIAKG